MMDRRTGLKRTAPHLELASAPLSNANHLPQSEEPAEEGVNVPGDSSCFPYGRDRQQLLEAEALQQLSYKKPHT